MALTKSITQTRQSDFQLSVLGASLTPESLRWALDQGAAGDLAAQNALFDLMEDTWDRLRGNVERLKKAVCKLPFTIQPWSEKGQKPSAEAVEKARFVEHVLHNQRAPTWEGRFNFAGTVHSLLDGIGRGVAVLEIDWALSDGRYVPTSTRRVPWACLGFDRRPDAPEPGSLRLFPDRNRDHPRRFSDFPHKFLVGVYGAKQGPLGEAAQLRTLAPLWLGRMLGWEWLLSRAELFGLPIRWATYDPASTTDQIAAVNNMLANMGTAAWGSFPSGTKLEILNGATPGVAGPNEPTERLMSLADTACDRLFLGATLTTTAGDRGSYAMASVHREIELDLYENYAAYVIDVLNNQMIPAIVALNWGEADELPFLEVELQRPAKDQALAERDRLLFQEMGLPVSSQWLYDRHKVPPPGPQDVLFVPCVPAPSAAKPTEARSVAVHAFSESTAMLLVRQKTARALLDQLLPLAEATGHRVVWTSILDDQTTDYCKQMNGRAYGDGWTEPPPAHHNCRSTLTLVPVVLYEAPPKLTAPLPRPDSQISREFPENV